MSHGKSCFFIGHREADERLLPRLKLTIERLITEENVRFFYVGEYGGFDRIAAATVNKRECTVNEYDAFQCEIADRTYLCWTLSSEISCVIEYDADAIKEENILRMAESVSLPD